MGRSGFAVACALLAGTEGLRNIQRRSACGVKGAISNQTNIAIVNGQDADECEWSWQVGLRRLGSSSFFCGGMLIDPEWILTAAHCMGRQFEVVVGAYSMRTTNDQHRQVRYGENPVSHPSYSRSPTDYDYAVVKLDSPFELGDCVGTVCLPAEEIAPGSECWITGWGTLRSGGNQPDILQEAPVIIRSNNDCGSYGTNAITERMLCAQGTTSSGGITDACQGDSGGPLVCEVDGNWVLHGATSWGRGCAGASYPGIWARITDQMDWIEDTMANPPPAPTTTPAPPPTTAPPPTPAPPPCPDFSIGPDSDGDCLCRVGKCSLDGGATFMCPSSGGPGGYGGEYFLPSCAECQCPPPPATVVPPCPEGSVGPDGDGDCTCRPGRCSLDGGATFKCPTSGVPGGWGGFYFLSSCEECQCIAT